MKIKSVITRGHKALPRAFSCAKFYRKKINTITQGLEHESAVPLTLSRLTIVLLAALARQSIEVIFLLSTGEVHQEYHI